MNFRRPIMTMVMALALFMVAGGHWAMLQSVAWAGMVKDFSRTGSIAEAVTKTFDGKHPCSMCKKIAAAQAHEEKAPVTVKIDKKAEVFVKAPGSELPTPVSRPFAYGPAPFVSMTELCFAPPVPVPISARS
ncbi:MAG: hypothetical protein NTW91_00960 [Verrucomicrobia bacterium]|nr:hypothetical protein [Verrucomicrobiota bacterium]